MTLPSKFDTPEELARIFVGTVDQVDFTWIKDDGKLSVDALMISDWLLSLYNSFEGEFSTQKAEIYFLKLSRIIYDRQFMNEEKITSISLPMVEKIGDEAFSNSPLTSLFLPKVKIIGDQAFGITSKLISLDIPNVETISDQAFFHCPLASLSLPKVKSIGDGAFHDSKLTSLSLPEVTEIGEYAFYLSKLTSLDLPKVSEIGKYAFNLVDSPDTKVTLPSKFNTPEELARIFLAPVDQVSFTWV